MIAADLKRGDRIVFQDEVCKLTGDREDHIELTGMRTFKWMATREAVPGARGYIILGPGARVVMA